jgi:hypothetical protein
MRSCEYLKVAKPDQRRTKILRLRNVRFFRGVEQLVHDHRELEEGQMASQDAQLCPVRAEAAIVRRIKKYPGSSQDSPISAS